MLIAGSDGAGDLKSVCETTGKLVKLGIVLAAYAARKVKLAGQPLGCQNRCLRFVEKKACSVRAGLL